MCLMRYLLNAIWGYLLMWEDQKVVSSNTLKIEYGVRYKGGWNKAYQLGMFA